MWFALLTAALAAPLGQVPVQGHAIDDLGQPLQGNLQVIATLSDGTDRWTEAQTVAFQHGAFTVYLGAAVDLDLNLFAEVRGLSLHLTIDGDPLAPIPLAHTPLAAFAERAASADEAAHAGSADWADDAATLQGQAPSDFLPAAWAPAWTVITGRPPGLDDGDDDTTYTAGSGLDLTGTTFSLDESALTDLITATCYDTPGELSDALDELFLLDGWLPPLPPDLLDGDNDTTYTAGPGLDLTGTTFSLDDAVLTDQIAATCYDTADELADALDELFLLDGWLPPLPPDLLDGDDDTTYTAGPGLDLTGTTFSLDEAAVTELAAATCYDTPQELSDALAGAYLPADWLPTWPELHDVPADLLDGDQDTTYNAGPGLSLAGTTFAADVGWVEDRARTVCYDTEAELLQTLNDNYRPANWRPSWGDITSIPGDIADGDHDTRYGAGDGLTLNGTTFAADASVARMTDNYGDHRFQRAVVERLGSVIRYQMSNGVVDSLDVNAVASGATAFSPGGHIAYIHGGATADSSLFLSIADMTGHACMLLHDDDDAPRTGWYYATDANSSMSWAGGSAPKFFHLKREGQTGRSVIDVDQKFSILCL